MFRFVFFAVFGSDLGGAPIWSGCSAAFSFVQVCSDLFRGDSAWVAVPGVRGWVVDREVGIGSNFRSSGDMVARLEGVGGWRAGAGRWAGGEEWGCACSRRSTPHLTSPLEGGRDELGEEVWVRGGSCLRRNDGDRRRNDGRRAGGEEWGCACSRRSTPHLTSP